MLDWMNYEIDGTYVPSEIMDAYGEYMDNQPYRDGMEMRIFFDEED